MAPLRKALGILVSLVALAGVLVTGALTIRRIDQRPRTDDAYLQADLVHMAPDVSGRIVELDVRDNQAVHKGEVLFRIDAEPYRFRADQARAAVLGLEAKVALTADQVAAQTSGAGAAARGVGSAEAQRVLASSTLARLEPLLGRGFVTAQQVDQARTAQITLQQAQLQADEARQAITNTKPTEAELEGARATLALAERDLNKTVVRAPCDGRITALDIAAREFAAVEGRAHIHSDYALLANVIVAAEGATFQDVGHFAVGVTPGDGIFTTWSYRAGAGRAEAFLLNPQPLPARTAYEWGVVAEVVPNGKAVARARELADLYLQAPEVTRRNTRIHFIQPLKERIVREVGYGLSLEGASSADLVKSKKSNS